MKSASYTIILTAMLISACASRKSTVGTARGNTRTTPLESIDERTYLLTEATDDKTYAYTKSNPVKVGGLSPSNERRFLNALLGPNGEPIWYKRAGSCCPFKTPNGMMENTGLLDIYLVTWSGSKDTLTIYINMYDEGDLKIPVGLLAKKKGN